MSRLHIRETLPVFGALFVLAFSLVVSNKPVLGLRTPQKKVISGERVRNDKDDPVTISETKLGDRELARNEEFDADDEWLRNVSFKVKNRSNKNVTFVGIDMYFPDTENTGAIMLRPLRFGQWPARPDPAMAPLSLKPGETIEISLGHQYASLKRFLESRQSISTIKNLMVRVFVVIFDDGTKWGGGDYYKPDPGKPSGYSKIKAPSGIMANN